MKNLVTDTDDWRYFEEFERRGIESIRTYR